MLKMSSPTEHMQACNLVTLVNSHISAAVQQHAVLQFVCVVNVCEQV